MKVIEVRILTKDQIHRGFQFVGGPRTWKLEGCNLDDAGDPLTEEAYRQIPQVDLDARELCVNCFGQDLLERAEVADAIEELKRGGGVDELEAAIGG